MAVRRVFAIAASAAIVALGTPALAQDPFARAEKIIKQHQLLTPKQQRCSRLVLREESNKRVVKIGVYELHDEACGGDPEVEHRLFDLEINTRTGAAKWDNNYPDMEMRPVPKRRNG